MTRRWEMFTPDKEKFFIQEIKANPILWDSSQPGYRRKDLKRSVWEHIAKKMGPPFNAEIVSKRFVTMKQQCWNVRRKIREAKQSGDGSFEHLPRWRLYNLLGFLLPAESSESTNNEDCPDPFTYTSDDYLMESNGIDEADGSVSTTSHHWLASAHHSFSGDKQRRKKRRFHEADDIYDHFLLGADATSHEAKYHSQQSPTSSSPTNFYSNRTTMDDVAHSQTEPALTSSLDPFLQYLGSLLAHLPQDVKFNAEISIIKTVFGLLDEEKKSKS